MSTPTANSNGHAAVSDPHPTSLWRNRDYQLIMSGRTLAVIGAAMTGLAVMLLAYDLTGNAATASVVMSFNMIGMVIMSLPAGALVDRWNRKPVMVLTSLVQALVLASVPVAMAFDALTIPHLCAVTLVVGALGTFYGPAEQASLRRIVRPEQLGTAMAVNQARGSLGSVVGPPLAGALYGVSRIAPLLGDALANLAAGLLAAMVRTDLRPHRDEMESADASPGALWREMMAGLRFTAANRTLRVLAVVAALLNLSLATTSTAIILAMQQAGEAPTTIGFFETVLGVTGLAGAVVAPMVLQRIAVGSLFRLAMSTAAVLAAATIWWDAPWQLMICFGAMVAIFSTLNPGLMAYFMAVVPDRMQGRAMATLGLLSMGLIPLGTMLAGFLLEHLGRTVAIGSGVGLLVLIITIALFSHTIRSIPRTAEFEITE